ncbi:hypothetical protein [Bradyrhizobium commune]|uniref:Uncharacterized protein n=1 Tax=Bradyrhizobium commune TaxID=83627 RepID=A0A7S9DBA7_9BRAD|nr:hypothetical protein [Bradyrhizobium commune]QPF94659.1 hypothetical protein IC761_15910 [Bradyrhizobium commune]
MKASKQTDECPIAPITICRRYGRRTLEMASQDVSRRALLDAAGLPELITRTCEDCEALANQRFTRGALEAAYEAMPQRYQAGLPPEHIDVQAQR